MGRITTAGNRAQSDRRYAAIDLLRIVAAAAVVAYHYGYLVPSLASNFPQAIQTVAAHGYLGVELFFMISGYVISLSAANRTRTRFAYARLVRLWPAFIICLALTVVAQSLAGQPHGLVEVLANLTMLPHVVGVDYIDGVYWSLMMEIFFYTAIAALVISKRDYIKRLRIFTIIWLAAGVVGQFVELPKIKVILVLDYVPYFAVGISIFLVRNAGNAAVDRLLLVGSVAVAMTVAALQSRLVGLADWSVHPNPWVCAIAVLVGAMALYLSTTIQVWPWLRGSAVMLGGLSYPLYLLHSGFGSVLADTIPIAPPLSSGMALAIVAATCYLVLRVEAAIRDRLMRLPIGRHAGGRGG